MTFLLNTIIDLFEGVNIMATLNYQPSARVKGVPVSATLKVNEKIALMRNAGESVFHMGFGESPFPVHSHIQDALKAASASNQYPPTLGLPQLCELARNTLSKKLGFNGANVDTLVAPGSKDLLFASQLAIAGDLLLPTPSWVSYAPQAQLAGTSAIKIPTQAKHHHALRGALISQTVKSARENGLNPTKIILNYPNNPTGLGFSESELKEVANACRDNGLIVISDEIYGLVSHSLPHQSIAHYYPEGTIVTTGLSKHLSIGGYRVGFAFIPKSLTGLLGDMAAIASETWSCVSHPIQYASIAALEGNQDVEDHIQLCTKAHGLVSNYVRDCILEMGIEYPPLVGAFYMYPDFSQFYSQLANAYSVKTSTDLADNLLDHHSLATLPGVDFGDDPQVLTLRLAITDYDGKAALNYLAEHPDVKSSVFANAVAPRVVQACAILSDYISSARSQS